MPNNPSLRRARLTARPAGNRIARNATIATSLSVANKLNGQASAELGNPNGGPTAIPTTSIAYGRVYGANGFT